MPVSSASDGGLKRPYAGFICLLANVLWACEPLAGQLAGSFGGIVVIPGTDATPPRVTLRVDGPDGSGHLPGAGQPGLTVPIQLTDSVVLVAVAEDAEGVRAVGINGHVSVACTYDNGIGTRATYGPIVVSYDHNGRGTAAFQRYWVPLEVTPRFHPCPGRSRPVDYVARYTAYGVNFEDTTIWTAEVAFVWNAGQ